MTEASARHAPLGFRAFVALQAALVGLNAFAVDIMLPGLPKIAESYNLEDRNTVQAIISSYLIGFGFGHLFMGVLSDRYGRKPVLVVGLIGYVIAAVVCVVAPTFGTLLVARAVQGICSSAPGVVSRAVVRDCYDGRTMARVMSLTMSVFMIIPVIAPTLGQLILLVADWHTVFGFLVAYGVVLLFFCATRLPETLPVDQRRAIRPKELREGLASVLGSRQTVGYSVAGGVFFGSLFGFLNSAQQIFVDVLHFGVWFPAVFAATATSMSLSSFLNSRLVERFGMRLLSHFATTCFLVLALIMLAISLSGAMNGWILVPMLMAMMLLVGMVFANFASLAMEPQGHVAGIASSVNGAVTILIGAFYGFVVGQSFDGTTVPMATGFVISGGITILILLVIERGRLYRS
jgi:MFS transporter, DHA1 family, multidrug resistance protein